MQSTVTKQIMCRLLSKSIKTKIMTTVKRIFGATSENREAQKMSRRDILNISQKRDVWNSRRRYGY